MAKFFEGIEMPMSKYDKCFNCFDDYVQEWVIVSEPRQFYYCESSGDCNVF